VTSIVVEAVWYPAAVAESVALPAPTPLTVKVPDVCPAGMVRLKGATVKTAEAALASVIVTPPAGAGRVSCSVPSTVRFTPTSGLTTSVCVRRLTST
jgi:hypothetical protein